MLRLFTLRLLQTIPVLLLATVLVFGVTRLIPGDPATVQLGMRLQRPGAAEALAALRKELGLNRSLPVQYGLWLKRTVRGDLGTSSRYGLPVRQLIAEKLPITLELILAGMLGALLAGLALGVLAAVKHRTVWDSLAGVISLVGVAVPTFWLGILLIILFSVHLRWLPAGGYVPLSQSVSGNLKHLVLPGFSLFVFELAIFTRFIRSNVIEVLSEDYVRAARAKGLPARRIQFRYVLRNSLGPLVIVMALEFGTLFGGVVIIEQIFRWPGLGLLTLQAITDRDFPIIQGVVLVTAVIVTLSNLLADVGNILLNPKLRDVSR
jgi:peptide/nickel transport system permease protein